MTQGSSPAKVLTETWIKTFPAQIHIEGILSGEHQERECSSRHPSPAHKELIKQLSQAACGLIEKSAYPKRFTGLKPNIRSKPWRFGENRNRLVEVPKTSDGA